MRTLFAAALLLFAMGAPAATLNGSFTYPITFVDGSPLTLAQIEKTRIEFGTCVGGAFGVKQGETTVFPPATAYTISGLIPGTYCIRGYTKATAAAGGAESSPTGVVTVTIPYPAPNPPVLGVINITAYETKQNPTGIMLGRNVGTVPLGTPCYDTPLIEEWNATYYPVPVEAVTFTKPPKAGTTIVAACRLDASAS